MFKRPAEDVEVTYVYGAFTSVNTQQMWEVLEQLGLASKVQKANCVCWPNHFQYELWCKTGVWQSHDGCRLREALRNLNGRVKPPFKWEERPNQPRGTSTSSNRPLAQLKSTVIATWNITGLKSKIVEVSRWMYDNQALLVGFQETRVDPSYNRVKIPGYNYFGTPGTGKAYHHGVALLLHEGIAATQERLVEGSQVWVKLSKEAFPMPYPVVVGVLYISAAESRKQKTWDDLSDYVTKWRDRHHEVILMGDFNCQMDLDWGAGGHRTRTKLTHLEQLVEKLSLSTGVYLTNPCTYRRHGKYVSHLDHILCTPRLRGLLQGVKVVDSDLSDHACLSLKMWTNVKSSLTTNTSRVESLAQRVAKDKNTLDKLSCKLSSDRYKNRFQVLAGLSDMDAEHETLGLKKYHAYCKIVTEAMEDVVPPPRRQDVHPRQPKLAKWYNGECRAQRAKQTKVYHRLRKAVIEEEPEKAQTDLLKEWKDARVATHRLNTSTRRKAWNAQMEHVSSLYGFEPHKFWKALGVFGEGSKRGNPCTVKDTSGTICYGADAAAVWHDHLGKLAQAPRRARHSVEEKERCDRAWSVQPADLGVECMDCNDPVTVDETRKVLDTLPNWKAVGPDGWPYEILKAMGNKAVEALASIYSLLITERGAKMPRSWLRSYVVPVPKDGDLLDVNNWRGIALMDCNAKAFLAVVLNRIVSRLEARNFFIPEQAGFRPNQECPMQTMALVETLQRRKRAGLSTVVAFVDLRKAYDTVLTHNLFHKLAKAGIGGGVLNIIRCAYQGATQEVTLGHFRSEPYPYEVGVKQGCVLSPCLFDIFINDILDGMIARDLGVKVPGLEHRPMGPDGACRSRLTGLLFADDLVLTAEPGSLMMQQMLNLLGEWSTTWGMSFGIKKCGVMPVLANGEQSFKDWAENHHFTLRGEEVPIVESYRYLGTTICKDLSFAKEREIRTKKLVNGLHAMGPGLRKEHRLSIRSRVVVTKTKVLAGALWGCEVWLSNRNHIHGSEKAYHNAIKQVLGTGSRACAKACLREVDSRDVYSMARRRQVRAYLKWMKMPSTWAGALINQPLTTRGLGAASPHSTPWTTSTTRWFKAYPKVDLGKEGLTVAGAYKLLDDYAANRGTLLQSKGTESAGIKWHREMGLECNKLYLKDASLPVLDKVFLAKARLNALETANRLRHKPDLDWLPPDMCPFCHAEEVEDMVHLLFKCDSWESEREDLESTIKELVTKATNGNPDNDWGLPSQCDVESLMGPLLGGGPWPGSVDEDEQLSPDKHYEVVRATARYLGQVGIKREHQITLLAGAQMLVRGQVIVVEDDDRDENPSQNPVVDNSQPPQSPSMSSHDNDEASHGAKGIMLGRTSIARHVQGIT